MMLPSFGFAATQFLGGVSANWEDAGNWSNGLPSGSNSPIIPSSIGVVFLNSFQSVSNINCQTFLFALDQSRLILTGDSNYIKQLDLSGFFLGGGATIDELRWVKGTMVGVLSSKLFNTPNVGANEGYLGEINGSATWIMEGTSNFRSAFTMRYSGFTFVVQAGIMNVLGSSLQIVPHFSNSYTFRNDGTINIQGGTNNLGPVVNQGTIAVNSGDTTINIANAQQEIRGSWFVNAGILRFTSFPKAIVGSMEIGPALILGPNGQYGLSQVENIWSNVLVRGGGSLDAGPVTVQAPSTVVIQPGCNFIAPSIKVNGLLQMDGSSLGAMDIQPGGTLVSTGTHNGILNVHGGASFWPGGTTLDDFYVFEDVTLMPGSVTHFNVKGANPGQYDRVYTPKKAVVGGTLRTIPLSGMPIGSSVPLVEAAGGIAGKFSDFITADSRWYLDYEPTRVMLRSAQNLIGGRVAYEGVGNPNGARVFLEMTQGGKTVQTTGYLNAQGDFSVGSPFSGVVEYRIKGETCLSDVVVADLGVNPGAINLTLLNGDCDGDNYVGTDDYLILNKSFDKAVLDSGFDPRADLNRDGYVGTDDYLLLNKNFDLSGF